MRCSSSGFPSTITGSSALIDSRRAPATGRTSDRAPAATSARSHSRRALVRPASARASSSRSETSLLMRCEDRSAEPTAAWSSSSPAFSSEAWSSSRLARMLVSGRAELVRCVGHELALALHRLLGLGSRLIERAQHLLEGVARARRPRRRWSASACAARGRGSRRSPARRRSARRSGASPASRPRGRRDRRARCRRARRRRGRAIAGRSSSVGRRGCGRTGRKSWAGRARVGIGAAATSYGPTVSIAAGCGGPRSVMLGRPDDLARLGDHPSVGSARSSRHRDVRPGRIASCLEARSARHLDLERELARGSRAGRRGSRSRACCWSGGRRRRRSRAGSPGSTPPRPPRGATARASPGGVATARWTMPDALGSGIGVSRAARSPRRASCAGCAAHRRPRACGAGWR